ncbi:glutamate receptor-like [Macrobrachium nipponense]|uniref:glutamate receptor-like n=1 Tax=Macrobrachium nipponense TaxID=159736 RepID=UPI0030C877C6
MAQSANHLRVAVGSWPPWCELAFGANGSVEATGIAVEIFKIVVQKMNYTYTYVTAGNDEWGRLLQNGTWTGLIGMNVYGKSDMALGPFVVSWVRSLAVDYSSILYFDHNGIFLPRPRQEKDLANFTRPLSAETWLALAVVLGLSAILGLVMNHLLSPPTRYCSGELQSLLPKYESGFNPVWIIAQLLNEPYPVIPPTHTGRVFMVTWLIAAFIIDAAYVGVLTSILAVPRVTIPVDSLEDLVSYGKIPWAIEEGTSLHQLLQQATEGLYKDVYDKKSYMVYGCYEARDRVKSERMAVLCDMLTMRKAINDDFSTTGQCNFHIARRPIFALSIAYAFPKKSKLTEEFNKWLIPLSESGLVIRRVLDSTSNATSCMRTLGKSGPASPILAFMDLAGVFALWIGGLFLSTIFLAAELVFYHTKLSDYI